MLITLFTDVSYDHVLRIGAYAWSAEVNGDQFRGGGLFHDDIENHNVAQIYGVFNGVSAAIHQIKPPTGSTIVAESDSGVAVAALQGRVGRYAHLCQTIHHKLAQGGLHIEYHYVEPHQRNATSRSWCDRIARALMRERRKAFSY